MSDNREAILARLEELLGEVSGIVKVWRDRSQIAPTDATELPAIVVLDGKEQVTTDVMARKTVLMPPAMINLSVQVWLVLRPRDNPDNLTLDGAVAPVGPELSAYREKILAAVLNDPTLISLVSRNGQIDYRGSETDMAIGATMVGMMCLYFDFSYVFEPPRP